MNCQTLEASERYQYFCKYHLPLSRSPKILKCHQKVLTLKFGRAWTSFPVYGQLILYIGLTTTLRAWRGGPLCFLCAFFILTINYEKRFSSVLSVTICFYLSIILPKTNLKFTLVEKCVQSNFIKSINRNDLNVVINA